MTLEFSCIQHPRYRGKGKLRGKRPCTACEALWLYANGYKNARETLMAVFHLLRVVPDHFGK